jgi:uncharacterized membrane protein (UPF0127 family)
LSFLTLRDDRAAPRAVLFCLLVAALVIMMVGAVRAQSEMKMRRDTLTLHTASGAHRIDIEVAENDREKAYGLMFRRSLGDSEGMLFPYPTAHEITMWMRNTFISLDMIFIRADGIVHRIEMDTEPHSERIIASEGDVTGVLEMKAGSARRLGLKPGDRVEYAHFKSTAKR